MARYTNGPNGTFSGRIGSVIGSSWKGIPYLRSRPAKSNKPVSAQKKAAQNAFSFMNNWLKQMHPLVMIGFENYNPHATGRNSAHSYNSKHALLKMENGFAIDFEAFRFSYGNLPGASETSISVDEESNILLKWSTELSGAAQPGDGLMYLLYFPELQQVDYAVGFASRKDGEVLIPVREEWKGQQVRVQVAFKSLVNNEVSMSGFVGGGEVNNVAM